MSGDLDDHTQEELRRLATRYAELGRVLAEPTGSNVDPDRIVRVVRRAIPSARSCGLVLVRPHRRARTMAASDALAADVEDIQQTSGEGPGIEAAATGAVVVSADLSVDGRWPSLGRRCARGTRVRSALGVGLTLGGGDRAAFTLYSTEQRAFEAPDVAAASIVAPFVGLAVERSLHSQDVSELEAALRSSRQIGMAIGVIMARDDIGPDEAFARLRTASHHLNRKIRDIAAEVTHTGELPDQAGGSCSASRSPGTRPAG